VPDGWVRSVKRPDDYPSMISFTDPLDARWELAIDTAPKGRDDPVADWKAQEKARLADKLYANYEQVLIEPITLRDGWVCADWQWRYNAPSGRLHVSNIGCKVSTGKGHAIYWQVPDALWDDPAAVNKFNIIKLSFALKP
jgi:hypothetical protein